MKQRAASVVGFLCTGAMGGATMVAVGSAAIISGVRGVPGLLLSIVSFLGLFGSLLAPYALVLFIGKGQQGKSGTQVVKLAAHVFTVVFLGGIGLVGVYFLGPLGVDSWAEVFVFLDGVFGFVWGGIIGAKLTRSLFDTRWEAAVA